MMGNIMDLPAMESKNQTLMRLENVSRNFVMGEVIVEALRDVTLEINAGEILAILGPSGSGKSTLLNIVGGMDRPSTGRVIYEGEDLTRVSDDLLGRFRRHEVGFVFQFYNLIPDLTAWENVEITAELVESPSSVAKVLEEVGLADRAYHFPSQLSGGEQQRVSIARAMVKNPRLLLCDEPTGALDHQTGSMVLSLLANVSRSLGSAVVIVTHNTVIGDMADRVIRMRSGKVAEIITNPDPLPPERISW
jgi:putative ABC transport system ATP-binding protein